MNTTQTETTTQLAIVGSPRGNRNLTAGHAQPIAKVYEDLAVAIANAVSHPDVSGVVDMGLAEFVTGVMASAMDIPRPVNPPAVTADFARAKLVAFLKQAHNRLAERTGLAAGRITGRASESAATLAEALNGSPPREWRSGSQAQTTTSV